MKALCQILHYIVTPSTIWIILYSTFANVLLTLPSFSPCQSALLLVPSICPHHMPKLHSILVAKLVHTANLGSPAEPTSDEKKPPSNCRLHDEWDECNVQPLGLPRSQEQNIIIPPISQEAHPIISLLDPHSLPTSAAH